MKAVQFLVALCALFAFPEPAYSLDFTGTLSTPQGNREYIVHVPGNYASRNLPVLLVLHGDGGSGASIKGYSGFDAVADTENFMAVYPTAQQGNWARAKGERKDVDFISLLIDDLCQRYKINTSRVYVTGHSAGGFMAYNLAMSIPSKIAAIAPVAANMYAVNGFNWNSFFASNEFRARPVLHIHGDSDATVTYPDPNHAPDSWNEWPLSSLAYFTCGQTTYSTPQQNVNSSGSVKKIVFCNPGTSNEISLIRIVGGGHGWPNVSDWNTGAAIWDFLKNHSITGTADCATLTFQSAHKTILDPCGRPFTPRGVNYSLLDDWDFPGNINNGEKSAQIIQANPNVVRIQWYANYGQPSRPAFNLSHLDQVISRFRNRGIVSLVGLWDLTCSNDYTRFNTTITPWWQQPDVLALIAKHQSYLMINPANEFGNVNWTGNPSTALATWTNHYKTVITALRNSGIVVPIVIDAPDCGTNLQPLLDRGAELQNHDPLHNLVFSVHTYWSQSFYSDNQITNFLASISNAPVPIILGEVANYQSDTEPCQYLINLDHILEQAQNRNIGWLAWTWFKDNCSDRQIAPSGSFSGLSAYGNHIVNNPVYGLATQSAGMHTECLSTPLPVQLTSFTTEWIRTESAVALHWQTEQESNFRHFTVERSSDARNFYEIAEIAGKDVARPSETYSFNDTNAPTGYNYYRLKLTDLDNSFSFSKIEAVYVPGDPAGKIRIYPVPADRQVIVNGEKNHFPSKIEIVNLQGIVVLAQTVKENGKAINTSAVPAGIYSVKSNGTFVQRILIAR